MSSEAMQKVQLTPSKNTLYLLYHELRPSPTRYSYITESAVFQKHVELFVQLRNEENAGLRPELTFDDGHRSDFEYAFPILQSQNFLARFFITAGWTGQKLSYMGWPELRLLHEAGHSIGAHGWTHTLLTHCNDRELDRELKDARHMLEDKLGTPITTMSLPGGRYNQRVLSACEQAGYTRVFSSIPRAEPTSKGSTVGRLNVTGDMHPGWLLDLFTPHSRSLDWLGRQYRIKEGLKSLLGDRMYGKVWALLNRKEPETDDDGNGPI